MTDKTKAFAVELLREKWLTALEQNKYKQCRGRYVNDFGAYCALGVLMVEAGQNPKANTPSSVPYSLDELAELAGVSRELIDEIPIMNDDDKLSFPEIAEQIRKELRNGNIR
jgi:hypothetical protein